MKNLKNLGIVLSRVEQKAINGGQLKFCPCSCNSDDGSEPYCGNYGTLLQCCD